MNEIETYAELIDWVQREMVSGTAALTSHTFLCGDDRDFDACPKRGEHEADGEAAYAEWCEERLRVMNERLGS